MFRRFINFVQGKSTVVPFKPEKGNSPTDTPVKSASASQSASPENKQHQRKSSCPENKSNPLQKIPDNDFIQQVTAFIEAEITRNKNKTLPRTKEAVFLTPSTEKNPMRRNVLWSDFLIERLPETSIQTYLSNLRRHLSDSSYLAALINIKKYLEKNTTDWLHEYNINNLLMVSLLTSHKLFEDDSLINAKFVDAGGLRTPLSELKELEIIFLKAIEYDTNVSPEEIQHLQKLLDNPSNSESTLFFTNKLTLDKPKYDNLSQFTLFKPLPIVTPIVRQEADSFTRARPMLLTTN